MRRLAPILALSLLGCAGTTTAAGDVAPSSGLEPCKAAAELRARAQILVDQGRIERALHHLDEAGRICPRDAREIDATRGSLLAELGLTGAGVPSPEKLAAMARQGRAIIGSDPVRARKLLDAALLGLERATGATARVEPALADWSGHEVYGVALAPNDTRAVVIAKDALIVLDPKTWEEHQRIEPVPADTLTVRLANDPDQLVFAGGDQVSVWRTSDAKVVATARGRQAELGPDLTTLVTGTGTRTLEVHRLPELAPALTLSGHRADVSRVGFLSSTHLLAVEGVREDDVNGNASGNAAGFHLWDLRSGKALFDVPRAGVTAVAESPDGKWLAVASFDDKRRLRSRNAPSTLQLHDTVTGKVGVSVPLPDPPHHGDLSRFTELRFSKRGDMLAAANAEGFTAVLAMPSGKLIRKVDRAILFGVSGDAFACVNATDDNRQSLTITMVSREDVGSVVVPQMYVYSERVQADERTLVGWLRDGGLGVVDLRSGSVAWKLAVAGPPGSSKGLPQIQATRAGIGVVTTSSIELWDHRTGQRLRSINREPGAAPERGVCRVGAWVLPFEACAERAQDGPARR